MIFLAGLLLAQSGNQPPVIRSASANPNQARVGEPVSFVAAATDPDGDFLRFSWSFNDGSSASPYSSSPTTAYAYADPGHYLVVVSVTDGQAETSTSFYVGVTWPPISPQPASSGTLVYDAERDRVWCVNPDADTVTALVGNGISKLWETPVGRNPRTLAQAPDGTLWAACQDDSTLSVLARDSGTEIRKVALPYGSRPYGVCFSPDGNAAYVTMEGTGELAKLSSSSAAVLGMLRVGPTPRGIAITGDSRRILVTRFISPADRGEVVEVDAAGFTVVRTIVLGADPGPDTPDSSRGVPNYLSSITITPDGRRAWVPSKKDNTGRGASRDGLPLTFESSVRTIVSQIDLVTHQEDRASRVDLNNSDMAAAVRFSPAGDLAFVAVQGSNTVHVRDRYDAATSFGVLSGGGLAPQGLTFNATGTRLYVQNFMSRTVSVYDTSGAVSLKNFSSPLLGTVLTVADEKLQPQVLLGKQIFYNANHGPRDHDGRGKINTDGYLSCASCHLEGHSDHRVWDFTQAGEGLRNTISLLGRRGTGHGRVHWTANFDEIQDFEHSIRDLFGGSGLMDDAEFNAGSRSSPLGDPKEGTSVELDALAAYVSSLDRVHASPFRNPDGSLTAEAQAGRTIFGTLNCVSCHAGPDFTDSVSGLLHDVGTIKPSSGGRLGGTLTGLDTPTLKGIWETAPYLHDGSASTLLDVLTTANPAGKHGALSALRPQEMQQLAAYLQQIDEAEAEFPPSLLFVVRLPGAQGLGKVVLLADGTTALVSVSLSGLSGIQTDAHLHGPGPVSFSLAPGSFTDFRVSLTSEQAEQLKAGLFSLDVHTDGQEIRGQIVSPYVLRDTAPREPARNGRGCGTTGLEVLLLACIRHLGRKRG